MPVAVPDSVQTAPGVAVTIGVLTNDSGAGAEIVAYTQPAYGMLALNADRTFTYTPPAVFVGIDSFTYTLREDGDEPRSTGQVIVDVVRPNAAPVARDDVAVIFRDTSVLIPLLANDGDPDGDTLRIASLTPPAFGTTAIAGHVVHYTPDPGHVGVDSFQYTVEDGHGGLAAATVTVTVLLANAAPMAAGDMAMTLEGTPVTLDLLGNDTDADADPLTLLSFTLPLHGSVEAHPDQRVTYTPFAGYTGADGFTYSIGDGRGGTAQADVTIEVLAREPASGSA